MAEIVVTLALGVLLLVSVALNIVLRFQLRHARAQVARLESARNSRRPPSALRQASKAVMAVAGTAAKVRDQGVGSVLASSIEDFSNWAREDSKGIAKATAADGTVTIMFSDIEGSTEMNEKLGDRTWVKLLDAHNHIATGAFARYQGHVVKSQGDGFMVVFKHPGDAVSAALEIHRKLAEGGGRLRPNPLRVRIGMHRGAVVTKEDDIFGRNVALAARVASEAHGGETLVSDEVHEMLLDVPEFVFSNAFDVTLKGLAGTHRLWQVESG